MDLKLQNLHILVVPADIIRILASTRRIMSLDLNSLVVSAPQEEESDRDNDVLHLLIDLPCLTTLALKGLPPDIIDPIVQNLNPSTQGTTSIIHDIVVQGDLATRPDPFATFTARLISSTA